MFRTPTEKALLVVLFCGFPALGVTLAMVSRSVGTAKALDAGDGAGNRAALCTLDPITHLCGASGRPAGGLLASRQPADFALNTIRMSPDTIKGSTTLFGASPLAIYEDVEDGYKGSRSGFFVQQQLLGRPGADSDNLNTVAAAAREVVTIPCTPHIVPLTPTRCAKGDGTDYDSSGAFFASATVNEFRSGSIYDLTSLEADTGAFLPAQTLIRVGNRQSSYGNSKGYLIDSAFQVGVLLGSATDTLDTGWKDGMLFTSNTRDGHDQPVTFSILRAYSPFGTRFKSTEGIDLTQWDFTGNAFWSKGFKVDATGNVAAASTQASKVAALDPATPTPANQGILKVPVSTYVNLGTGADGYMKVCNDCLTPTAGVRGQLVYYINGAWRSSASGQPASH